jgi:hypothetical protein
LSSPTTGRIRIVLLVKWVNPESDLNLNTINGVKVSRENDYSVIHIGLASNINGYLLLVSVYPD